MEMEYGGLIILLAGAVVLGVARQYLIVARYAYAGVVTAIAAAVGGFVAAEYLTEGFSGWSIAWYGLHIVPALIGAVALAVVVEIVAQYLLRERRTHHPA
jgi:predicted lysophospholipase L1 biosynthesis ABC-type transport system permease subunit